MENEQEFMKKHHCFLVNDIHYSYYVGHDKCYEIYQRYINIKNKPNSKKK